MSTPPHHDRTAGETIVVSGSQPELHPGSDETAYYWNSYREAERCRSVPRHLDEHASAIRGAYLRFIHDLGETRIRGATVVQHLQMARGCSLWWTSSLAEKSPFKSARIVDCLKVLALEQMLRAHRPVRVRLHGVDRAVAAAIRAMCAQMGIATSGPYLSLRGLRLRPKAIFRHLPQPLQVVVWGLRQLGARWRLRRQPRPQWFEGDGAVVFFSYFFNISAERFAAGEFYSPQWGDLPRFLRNRRVRSNWVHHLLPSRAVPDSATAMRWVTRLNQDADSQGLHCFFEIYLSWRRLGLAMLQYFRLFWRVSALRGIAAAFQPRGSSASLWPLLAADWHDSTRGRVAAQSLVWIELFDALLADMPRQRLGLYLQENQGWERALIHAWRAHGHGALIGVAHSTIRFWDLRYFDDPRTLGAQGADRQPAPDAIAVNGSYFVDVHLDAGIERSRLVEVEALRFLYLGEAERVTRRSPAAAVALRLLVIGDSALAPTRQMLSCLAAALHTCGRRVIVEFKPHPWCVIDARDFGIADALLQSEAVGALVARADLVLGSTSSALLEAYCVGVRTLVFASSDSLNFSPLAGIPGVETVRDAGELAAAIARDAPDVAASASADFFHLDAALPRWTALLRKYGTQVNDG